MRFILIGLCILFSCFVHSERLKLDVSASSAILINGNTGSVLFEKNAHQPNFPASITKVTTALYALEKKGGYLNVNITASEDAVGAVSSKTRMDKAFNHPSYRLEFGGSHIGIKAGEILDLRTLLYGLMLCSGNDAANVIAEYCSGSVDKFIEETNAYLRKQGIKTTTLKNPHGLHDPEHVTTAYEMGVIASLAMRNPAFREIVKTVRYTRPETNKQASTTFIQSNKLLKAGNCFYPKAIGVKTGYTSLAGHTLVAAAEHEGRTLIAVLLNCSDLYQRYRDAIALFEAAFAEAKITRTLFNKEYDHFSVSLKGGATPLEASLAQDLTISYYPAEEPSFKSVLHWNNPKMPVQKNEQVGEIRLVNEQGKILKSVPLFAVREVPKTKAFRLLEISSRVRALLFDKRTLILILMALSSFLAYRHCKKLKTKEQETQ